MNMTVRKTKAPSGAAVEILNSGWTACTEAELDLRRSRFTQTAAELFAEQQPEEQTSAAVSGESN